jgi:proteic killer suppression protein
MEKFFATGRFRRHPLPILKGAAIRLNQLNAAGHLDDLRNPPSNQLEMLTGDRQGQWSVRINDQWRLCFRFASGDAFDVEIVDYH